MFTVKGDQGFGQPVEAKDAAGPAHKAMSHNGLKSDFKIRKVNAKNVHIRKSLPRWCQIHHMRRLLARSAYILPACRLFQVLTPDEDV